jgi:hypothetical protein
MSIQHSADMQEPRFNWPAGLEPDAARLYFRNERTIDAPAEQIWSWLVAAPLWQSWFPNATNVKILDGDSAVLRRGSRFRWSQSGVKLDSEVLEYEASKRLGWSARSPFIHAYHAWDIQPAERGCLVITDETQRGFVPILFGPVLKPRMLAQNAASRHPRQPSKYRPLDG